MEDGAEGVSKEPVLSKEVTFTGYRILDRVIGEGLWRYRGDNGRALFELSERLPNPSLVVSLAEEEIGPGKLPRENEEVRLPSMSELEESAHTYTEAFINAATQSGWLPKEAANLAHRITRVEDIKVISSDKNAGGLNLDLRYDTSIFPDETGEPREIWITEQVIRNRVEYYQGVAQEMDIELSREQLLAASIGSVSVHEWAHSVERGIVTQYEGTIKSLPEYDDKVHFWNVLGLARTVIYRNGSEVTNPILPNLGESDKQSAHGEQFASGFEFEATRFFLMQAGLPEEEATRFYDGLHERRQERLDDFQELRSKLGIPDIELMFLAMDVRTVIRDGNLPASYIPNLWDGMGYLAPYRINQLAVMIKNGLTETVDTSKMQLKLQELKNR